MRVCQWTGHQITCFGDGKLDVGDDYVLLGESLGRVVVRVTDVHPSAADQCRLGFIHDADITVVEGRPGTQQRPLFAVRGAEVIPGLSRVIADRGSLRSPSGSSQETVFFAADLDADSKADVLGVAGECSEAGRQTPVAPRGKTVTSMCIDYWRRGLTSWERVNRELVHFCY